MNGEEEEMTCKERTNIDEKSATGMKKTTVFWGGLRRSCANRATPEA